MKFIKLESSYTSSEFPKEFSNQLYFSEDTNLDEFSYRSSYSIKYVLSGQERYMVEGREMVVKPNQHLLVNNESRVTLLPTTGRAISIFIAPETLADVKSINDAHSIEKVLDNFNGLAQTQLHLHENIYDGQNPNVQGVLKKLAMAISSADRREEFEIDLSLFFQLSEALLVDQGIHSTRLRGLNPLKKSTAQEQYSRVLLGHQYLSDHWNHPFSLKHTANVAMLSPYHFHRLFRACFSTTPYQYHLEIQMNKALSLFREGSCSIAEISALLGFTSPTSFGRAFKKFYGWSPRSFANKQDV